MPRRSPIAAIVLTDAEMDHALGLLSLREDKSLSLVCTAAVKRLLSKSFALIPVLEKYTRIHYADFPTEVAGIKVTALELETSKRPRYSSRPNRDGSVVALRLESSRNKRCCIYLPSLPAITNKLDQWSRNCDCLIVDGTFWSEREMISLGFSTRAAGDMGHVPINGKGGSLEWLRRLNVPRKIYTHINNSNPILRKNSRERLRVESAGIEISRDQMRIRL